ncbi:MAG: helix-turn-helix domain-containing protein [Chloroflexi bacterium]|nr:MAG: helix-turn-helix domain-containing protein [Chloroflexota bacterium]
MRETITLNTHEQKRVMVLNRLLAGQLTATEAAVLLTLSERQVRRLLAAYRKEGAAALAHGNRGKKPKQRISDKVRHQVIAHATTTYAGSGRTRGPRALARQCAAHSAGSRDRFSQNTAPPTASTPTYSLGPGGHARADRWQSPCLVRGAWSATHADRGHR